jgi:hypothetical protein|tara:strand:+ start:3509 stop:3685 length:177 start_codon:yes stop_codon:yes gene_type:complete
MKKDKMTMHKMYCPDGKVHSVNTMKKHKDLMKKGCDHKKSTLKKGQSGKNTMVKDKEK